MMSEKSFMPGSTVRQNTRCKHSNFTRVQGECWHGSCLVVRVFRDGSYLVRNQAMLVCRFLLGDITG